MTEKAVKTPLTSTVCSFLKALSVVFSGRRKLSSYCNMASSALVLLVATILSRYGSKCRSICPSIAAPTLIFRQEHLYCISSRCLPQTSEGSRIHLSKRAYQALLSHVFGRSGVLPSSFAQFKFYFFILFLSLSHALRIISFIPTSFLASSSYNIYPHGVSIPPLFHPQPQRARIPSDPRTRQEPEPATTHRRRLLRRDRPRPGHRPIALPLASLLDVLARAPAPRLQPCAPQLLDDHLLPADPAGAPGRLPPQPGPHRAHAAPRARPLRDHPR